MRSAKRNSEIKLDFDFYSLSNCLQFKLCKLQDFTNRKAKRKKKQKNINNYNHEIWTSGRMNLQAKLFSPSLLFQSPANIKLHENRNLLQALGRCADS